MKKDTRPINVGISDLIAFGWPITAIASITHRIAGMVLFVGIAFALYGLQVSLSSEQGFNEIRGAIKSPFGILVTVGLLAALAYHFVAGIKHLMLDLGVGESLDGSITAARIVLATSTILILAAAAWVLQA